MKLITVVLILVACTPHKNRAADFASRVAPQSHCEDWGTDGKCTDLALCDLTGQLWLCRAGADDPTCKMVADLRPPAPPVTARQAVVPAPAVPQDAAP